MEYFECVGPVALLLVNTQQITVGGAPAAAWDITVTNPAASSYKAREIVLVHDQVGWKITLTDTASGFQQHLATFTRMVQSFSFR